MSHDLILGSTIKEGLIDSGTDVGDHHCLVDEIIIPFDEPPEILDACRVSLRHAIADIMGTLIDKSMYAFSPCTFPGQRFCACWDGMLSVIFPTMQ